MQDAEWSVTTMDPVEEQAMEMEALEAIYPDEYAGTLHVCMCRGSAVSASGAEYPTSSSLTSVHTV